MGEKGKPQPMPMPQPESGLGTTTDLESIDARPVGPITSVDPVTGTGGGTTTNGPDGTPEGGEKGGGGQ